MGKYHDVDCPICKKSLENGEDIVICPDCGAPYHRKCIEATGTCIYTDLHNEGKFWEAPQKENKYAGEEPRKCTRCGTQNPINGIFCEVCGNPLNRGEQTTDDNQQNHNHNNGYNYPNMGMGGRDSMNGGMGQNNRGGNPPFQMPFNAYTTPFGGLNADEVIDDIEIKDLAIFVGQSSHYFLPRFKQFSKNKKASSFNFGAAFFHGFYFLYRKMYLVGAVVLLAILTLSIPNVLISVDYVTQTLDLDFQTNYTSDFLITANNVCSFLQVVLRVFCGMVGNRLYKSHCVEKITKIRSKDLPHDEYIQTLTKQGSVSSKIIAILLGGYVLFSMLLSVFLVFFV